MSNSNWTHKTHGGLSYWSLLVKTESKECEITIEPRPSYCDRGNYLAKLFQRTGCYDIDSQDGWPRYYFDLKRAKLECEAWLIKRKLL